MSVFYRLHQDQSVGTKRSGKWYARMVPTSCINTRQLAEIMQRNCTVKKVADNIKGMHIVFTPERSTDAAGNRVKQFLQGAKCEELPENKVEKDVQAGD